ncbi:MAG: 4-hydroxy-3-methylbut-2-enyl diphosphate reductase [Erysipelotrichia bacterium]|nr:4-hydroxy-3-methylbut-2-enyl diphosphate reductase [Erysipelotrichia bacterium]NCC54642.1 4-hydroxy-3-methylbut-2-enyl diphosphate reductase [Erysipelotrichia bacterium]
MEIIKVVPRGYCKGVVRAINIAKETALKYPDQNIYILGMLVHNKYVIEALKAYNIITIDDKDKSREELLDTIDEGIVIFTAHGIHPKVKQKAIEKGLHCIDASCLDVLKTQEIVDEHLKANYEVLYIGKHKHPESSAVCDHNKHVHLIENEQDIQVLPTYKKVFVTNQTTMSYYDVEHLFTLIQKKYPNVKISDEICNATRSRQEAVANLKDVDALIVVGDKASNNANRLAQIAKEKGIGHVYLIDDVNDLDIQEILNFKKVGISAGASTPTYLINQVIYCLEHQISDKQIIEKNKIL